MANTKMNFSSYPLYLVLLFTISLNFLLTSATIFDKSAFMFGSTSRPTMHIVYTEMPLNESPEAYHIRILTSVLGSNQAASNALVYSFGHSISGFAAKLTPDEAEKISKQPGVLRVVKSFGHHLD